jgi:hypothetical protein
VPAAAHNDRGAEFVAALEAASRSIKDPVAKLKYIRGSLARYEGLHRGIGLLPSGPLRLLVYRWLSLEGLRHLSATHSLGATVTMIPEHRRFLLFARVGTVAAVLAVAAAATAVVLRPSRPAAAPQARAAAPATLPRVAEDLSPLPAGVKPMQIWLVEKGDGWEQYSNGLRVDVAFAAVGAPRRYRVFDESRGLGDEVSSRPVGILFHTSESDVWPLEAGNNERLRDSSHRLLRYVQRLKLYNYMIDRFGRVYRVVDEEAKANHAGNSIWARGRDVYLNLNNAFLGICFETRWEGGRALPITAAQLAAGRTLTDYLRHRWEIAPEMCVTHGLTSVNAKAHLIGHHVDWARGFPFEAFGLPNQYAKTSPSMALFGFGYDGDFLKVLGEPWAGVQEAERGLAREAQKSGRSVDEIRRQRQAVYDRWHEEQTRDEEAAASSRADAAAPAPAAPKRGPLAGG